MSITTEEYLTFNTAFNYFNKKLFNKELPECMITLQRKAKSRGYYHAEKFSNRTEKKRIDEIALNPDTFIGRKDIDILSTLAHEMVHLWQQHKGTPPRKAYHDKEWAKKMEEIGLMPSDTGSADGKKTGQRMTHYIIEKGKFENTCKEFLKYKKLNWQSIPQAPAEKKSKNKTKYSCPECETNAWAKPNTKLICGTCEETMIEQ